MSLWRPAYIGLGSNLDQPARRVQAALEALAELPATGAVRASGLFGSRPLGPVAQPDFVNAAAGLLTTLSVEQFFESLGALERRLGRQPTRERWGPRHIDLDLLAFGTLRLTSPTLVLPHPGIVERNFVLYPLAEVAPSLWLPGLGVVGALTAKVSTEGLWRLQAQ